MKTLICRDCGDPFQPQLGKPGFIDQCVSCAKDVPLKGGIMHWGHKTAPTIEICSLAQAKIVAQRNARVGTGVIRSIVSNRLP